jgi:tRNA G18 (ribose-2'-O)-methylase SpoU
MSQVFSPQRVAKWPKRGVLVSLPQVGEIASLNVAQASTALMYEWLRQNW